MSSHASLQRSDLIRLDKADGMMSGRLNAEVERGSIIRPELSGPAGSAPPGGFAKRGPCPVDA